jgi:hypothetical protein
MKKFLIGVVVAIVIVVAVYLLLPEGPRGYVDYYKMKLTDKETYAEIEVVQNAAVLNQNTLTYEDILTENVSYEYWTYESTLNTGNTYTKTVTAYGSNLTLTYGDGGDSGVCQDSDLKLIFVLDDKGGYNLTAYVDGVQLSSDDRDRLLAKMCSLAQ